ncbi:hypothetical protein JB92DRAFT_3104934 [Gautieria morchelliformis]|nr:hypothetical protein JB92DRAFT_3104934 [Gautieria morchelliformis]
MSSFNAKELSPQRNRPIAKTVHDRQPVANKAGAAFTPAKQKSAMHRAKDKVKVMVSTAKLGDPFTRNPNETSELLLDSASNGEPRLPK